MSVDQPASPRAAEPRSAPCQEPPAGAGGERAYDSFVVRIWSELGTGELLRAEVEHVQSGAVARGGRVPPEWITDQIRDRLAQTPAAADAASEGTEEAR